MRGSRGGSGGGRHDRPASSGAAAAASGRGTPSRRECRFPDLAAAPTAGAAAPGAAVSSQTLRGRGGARGRLVRGSPTVARAHPAGVAAAAPRGGGGGIALAGLAVVPMEDAGALAARLRADVAAGAAPEFIERDLAVVDAHGSEVCRLPGPPLWARAGLWTRGALQPSWLRCSATHGMSSLCAAAAKRCVSWLAVMAQSTACRSQWWRWRRRARCRRCSLPHARTQETRTSAPHLSTC